MFTNYTPFNIPISPTVNIHGVSHGSGPPLLLLHGFPQTHLIWHLIADQLATQYSVVALDLRGYGASSKPVGDSNHANYSKRALATDCAAVMKALGFEKFYICAHDRGARVAHKLCVDFPELVLKAIFLDICPTLAMYNATDKTLATAYFHWFFLIQPSPFPEKMIAAAPEVFLDHCTGASHAGSVVFHSDCSKAYLTMMKDPQAVHAMCEDYRAAATIDLEDARADAAAGRDIKCPIKVMWGKKGIIEKCFDALQEWKKVSATGEVEAEAVDCGHFIPEEAPEAVLRACREFLK